MPGVQGEGGGLVANSIRLVIGDIPPSLNVYTRMHWRKRSALQKRWNTLVWAACQGREIRTFDRAKVTIIYYFRTSIRHDPDNYSGKVILDGLRKAGVLTDDSFSNVTIHPVAAYDPAHPRTEIEVEAV